MSYYLDDLESFLSTFEDAKVEFTKTSDGYTCTITKTNGEVLQAPSRMSLNSAWEDALEQTTEKNEVNE